MHQSFVGPSAASFASAHVSHASQKRLSRLRRWSVELGSLAALQLLIACCSLCVLLLYMRLGPDKKKFVWNRIGQFSACVTANLVLGATATLASMNNQIWYVRCCQSAVFVTHCSGTTKQMLL